MKKARVRLLVTLKASHGISLPKTSPEKRGKKRSPRKKKGGEAGNKDGH